MAMDSVRNVRLLRKPRACARTSNRVCMTVAYATTETGAFDGDQKAKCSTTAGLGWVLGCVTEVYPVGGSYPDVGRDEQ